MQEQGTALICDEDAPTCAIAARIEGAGRPLVRVRTGDLAAAGLAEGRSPSLAGPHNAQNAALAAAICRQLGLSDDQIAPRACDLSRPAAPDGVRVRGGRGHLTSTTARLPIPLRPPPRSPPFRPIRL